MRSDSARYDGLADFYEGFVGDDCDNPTAASLLHLLPTVSGLRVLDLACGHGRFSRELARRGASVVGIDISADLVQKAREREAQDQLGIAYIHADATAADALLGEQFDGVTCLFALSDIDDLEGALATVSRVLRAGGFFVFSGLHPCFPGWGSRLAEPHWDPKLGYYEEGWWLASGPAHGVRAKIGSVHRTLSTYLNSLVRAGLAVEEVAEPPPTADWMGDALPHGAVPVYLAVRCRRTSAVR